VELQEQIGLVVVTDGEYRRLNFQDSFGESVSGYDAGRPSLKFYEQRVEGGSPLRRWEIPDQGEEKSTAVAQRRPVKAKLGLAHNVPREEFLFLKEVAREPGKVALIGPDRIAQRFDWQNSKAVYSGLDDFVADVVKIEREIIKGLVEAGCRYVQIDAPGYTAYVDPPSLAAMRARGEDPKENFSRSLRADNALLAGFDEVTFGIHLCRGNQRSMWHREGTYDDIAERLLNELKHDRFLFEYDTLRAAASSPAFFAQGQGDRAGFGQHQSAAIGNRRSIEKAHRRSEQICGPRANRDQPAVRLFLRRGRQLDQRRRSEAQAGSRRRDGAAGLGIGLAVFGIADYKLEISSWRINFYERRHREYPWGDSGYPGFSQAGSHF
jgi:methionine synthase II (cobalamin-independent)